MTTDSGPRAIARLLVVEDDPRIAAFLVKGLGLHGFHVSWVTTGEEALRRLDAGGLDLLLLDLGLPDMDGLDLLREQRARGMTLPVLVVTARTDPKVRGTALAFGVKGYLTKPFGLAALVSAVQSCLTDGVSPS